MLEFIRRPGINHFSRSSLIVCGLALLLCGVTGCKGKSPELQSSIEVLSIRDKIRIKELNGEKIDLNAYAGKTVFINFWATWCGPCIREMPSIKKVQETMAEYPVEFLVASNETVEQIREFASGTNLALHYVQVQNLEELAIPALPTTYIISPEGKLVFSETGYRKWDEPMNIELLTKIINAHE